MVKKSYKKHKKSSRKFGLATQYQNDVNDLTGAMGPKNPAFWKDVGSIVGDTASLAAQPLYYSPDLGSRYVTAFDQNASVMSQDFTGRPVVAGWDPSALSFGSKQKHKKSRFLKFLRSLKKSLKKSKRSKRSHKRSKRSKI
jgi:hypothetical protein